MDVDSGGWVDLNDRLAAAAIAHLGDAIDPARLEHITPVAPPWDDEWSSDGRTASWRA